MIPPIFPTRFGRRAALAIFSLAWVPGSLSAAPSAPVAPVGRVAPDQSSPLIDRLVDEGLVKAQMKPNAPASDTVVLRRLYVDIIGRIPTAQEATEFLNDKSPTKRAQLIDRLLASEGYVSHWFNYWADILRIKSNPQEGADRRGTGDAYAAWVKDQLRANTAYHKLVYQMLTARGFLWDTGAVGYYMRDAGMPLDNMANTCQVFLGTRVACAQCHNHPFDDYKQKDFYEMAAYTHGVQTRVGPKQILMEANGINKLSRDKEKKLYAPGVEAVLDDLLEPLRYGIRQDPKMDSKLPDDFRGDPKNPSAKDGKPGDEVRAQPVFSRERIKQGNEILENYAGWMTSAENPTFTVVVANRLWKACMGVGLIEPVDDIKKVDLDRNKNDATKLASNPALMAFLTQHMKLCGYDMKKFLRSIYNSKAYQREATTTEILTPEEYRFPGPAVRRMSAEQIWDSLVTLVIPVPDERKASRGYQTQLAKMKAEAEKLQDKLRAGSGRALLNLATDRAEVETKFDMEEEPWRKKLADARAKSDKASVDAAQAEIDKLESARFDARKKVDDKHKSKDLKLAGTSPFSKPVPMMDKDKMKKPEPIISEADQRKWEGYGAEWLRASELPSPAPNGHFLQEFGQSERDIIQAANADSSVTQALMMLNGPIFNKLTAKNTQLGQVFEAAKTPEEKRDQLFLTLLSRLPNDKEKALVAKQVQADGPMNGLRKVTWALVNTREFTFLQ